jgi:histidinol dehydrogenase
MPTAGAARYASPVSVFEFLKVTSIIAVPDQRLQRIGPSGVVIARAEGLPAHAHALELRLEREDYDDDRQD